MENKFQALAEGQVLGEGKAQYGEGGQKVEGKADNKEKDSAGENMGSGQKSTKRWVEEIFGGEKEDKDTKDGDGEDNKGAGDNSPASDSSVQAQFVDGRGNLGGTPSKSEFPSNTKGVQVEDNQSTARK